MECDLGTRVSGIILDFYIGNLYKTHLGLAVIFNGVGIILLDSPRGREAFFIKHDT